MNRQPTVMRRHGRRYESLPADWQPPALSDGLGEWQHATTDAVAGLREKCSANTARARAPQRRPAGSASSTQSTTTSAHSSLPAAASASSLSVGSTGPLLGSVHLTAPTDASANRPKSPADRSRSPFRDKSPLDPLFHTSRPSAPAGAGLGVPGGPAGSWSRSPSAHPSSGDERSESTPDGGSAPASGGSNSGLLELQLLRGRAGDLASEIGAFESAFPSAAAVLQRAATQLTVAARTLVTDAGAKQEGAKQAAFTAAAKDVMAPRLQRMATSKAVCNANVARVAQAQKWKEDTGRMIEAHKRTLQQDAQAAMAQADTEFLDLDKLLKNTSDLFECHAQLAIDISNLELVDQRVAERVDENVKVMAQKKEVVTQLETLGGEELQHRARANAELDSIESQDRMLRAKLASALRKQSDREFSVAKLNGQLAAKKEENAALEKRIEEAKQTFAAREADALRGSTPRPHFTSHAIQRAGMVPGTVLQKDGRSRQSTAVFADAVVKRLTQHATMVKKSQDEGVRYLRILAPICDVERQMSHMPGDIRAVTTVGSGSHSPCTSASAQFGAAASASGGAATASVSKSPSTMRFAGAATLASDTDDDDGSSVPSTDFDAAAAAAEADEDDGDALDVLSGDISLLSRELPAFLKAPGGGSAAMREARDRRGSLHGDEGGSRRFDRAWSLAATEEKAFAMLKALASPSIVGHSPTTLLQRHPPHHQHHRQHARPHHQAASRATFEATGSPQSALEAPPAVGRRRSVGSLGAPAPQPSPKQPLQPSPTVAGIFTTEESAYGIAGPSFEVPEDSAVASGVDGGAGRAVTADDDADAVPPPVEDLAPQRLSDCITRAADHVFPECPHENLVEIVHAASRAVGYSAVCDMFCSVIAGHLPINAADAPLALLARILHGQPTDSAGCVPLKPLYMSLAKEYQHASFGYVENLQARYAMVLDAACSAGGSMGIVRVGLLPELGDNNRRVGCFTRAIFHHCASQTRHVQRHLASAVLAQAVAAEDTGTPVVSAAAVRSAVDRLKLDANEVLGPKGVKYGPEAKHVVVLGKAMWDTAIADLPRSDGAKRFAAFLQSDLGAPPQQLQPQAGASGGAKATSTSPQAKRHVGTAAAFAGAAAQGGLLGPPDPRLVTAAATDLVEVEHALSLLPLVPLRIVGRE